MLIRTISLFFCMFNMCSVKLSLSLKFMVLLVSEQLFVTSFVFLFVVVTTINSYCLIMLYYSFSIAPPQAAMQLCCCCCCGFARFTVQARIERSLSLLLLFSLPRNLLIVSKGGGCDFASNLPFLLHISLFSHPSSFSRSRARTLCRSV